MSNFLRNRVLPIVLVAAMLFTMAIPAFAANADKESSNGQDVAFTKVNSVGRLFSLLDKRDFSVEKKTEYSSKDNVRVSIVLDGKSTIEEGYFIKDITIDKNAVKYRNDLKAKQDAVAEKISTKALGGKKLDVVWNLTLAANIISANVEYGQIEAIKLVPGVKDVFIENQYEPAKAEKSETADPNMVVASDMTQATAAWLEGYTGAGGKVAIVDTGLDTSHRSFDADAFLYAIDEVNAQRAEEGKAPIVLFGADDIAAVWDELNAANFIDSSESAYLNEKIPYAVNYVDRDLDVTHDKDTKGEHGSHVAGIAAGNKYVPGDNGFEKSLDAVKTQGEAPDAQLFIMKVFGRGGGAYESDYFSAIEDAIALGADSVNLSLGSGNAGFTTSSTYADLLDRVGNSNIILSISAGNSYYWANFAADLGYLYADDINYQTGGSPGTYQNSFNVASVENDGQVGNTFVVGGEDIFYVDNSGYGNEALTTIPGNYNFVYVDSIGTEDEFAAVAGILEGNIAICNRGEISFYQKANAAIENGAIAVIIANNQPGSLNMNLTGYTHTAPAVSISLADAQFIKASADKTQVGDINADVYTGSITVNDAASLSVDSFNSEYKTMSDYSSWGATGALTLKPEITAPGGNIWSANGDHYVDETDNAYGHDNYELMSGTSMAAPQIAGISAVVRQYIRENGLEEKTGITARQLLQSLVMSTATPLIDGESGNWYPVIEQGAGLVNVNAVINAKSYIFMDDSATKSAFDGKIKAELGEVARGDKFDVTFTVNNFSDEDIQYYLSSDFFTQDIFEFGNQYRDTWTTPLTAAVEWTINGEKYVPADAGLDFDGNGVSNIADAQYLLEYLAGNVARIYNADKADIDEDGDVDTYDAYLAFTTLGEATTIIEAGDSVEITATVDLTVPEELDVNGNYIEGYIFVKEGDTEEGVVGVEHSIPVLGFYGNFTDASMFDKGTYYEYDEDLYPYLYASGLGENAFGYDAYTIQYNGDSNTYALGGNPVAYDESYHPERNAINSADTVKGAEFIQIRNAGAARFFVTDADGKIISGTEIDFGPSYGAYYYVNGAEWRNTNRRENFGYKAAKIPEGSSILLNYQLAPEYYVNEDDSVRWDDLGSGASFTLPLVIDNTAPVITSAQKFNDTNALVVRASDNEYIAAVALWTEDGYLIDYYGSNEDATKGEAENFIFDLTDVEDAHLLIEVYDYACNVSSYKLNLNPEELIDAEIGVKLNTEEAVIIGQNSIQLVATVTPWGYPEDDVTWTSSDESVAVVDENGIVTGVDEGKAVVTATAVADTTKSASCEITVKYINKTLNGVVWDENGEVWISEFNLNSLPDYKKLNDSSLRLPITSLAYDQNGTLYAATFDDEDWVSTLYTVNEDTFEFTEVGASDIGYMDIAQAPSLGDDILLAVYGPYAVIVDAASGDYLGAFDLSSYTNGNYLVGIAYEEQYRDSRYGMTDWYFLVDVEGNIYNTGFVLNNNGRYSRFGVTPVGNLGYTVDIPYFQSLYFDGESLYWSRFNSADNKVDIIMVDDLYEEGMILNAGSFADNVWPVGGLYEKGINPYFGEIGASVGDHTDAVIDTDAAFTTSIEKLRTESKKAPAPAADIHSVTNEPAIVATNKVAVTADEAMTNGLITVTYDADKVQLLSAVLGEGVEYSAVNTSEKGTYVLAFVSTEGIAADDVIVTLLFSTEAVNEEVSIVTYQRDQ